MSASYRDSSSFTPSTSLEQQIAVLEADIKTTGHTIERLSHDGHETADIVLHQQHLMQKMAMLLKARDNG